MPAHVACRPWVLGEDDRQGCFVVCEADGVRQWFGDAHEVAKAACREHNRVHHPVAPRTDLLSLVYESVVAPAGEHMDLGALLRRSRAHNRSLGITGMLLMEDGWFLQALEGPPAAVDALMAAIARDPRHRHVRILGRELRAERRFPDWAMAEGHIGEVESLPLARYYEAMLLARGGARRPEPTGGPLRAEPDADPDGIAA